MKFDINNYKGKYAMHCKTKKEAREFCNYLHSIGKRWNNKQSYLDYICYDCYDDATAYAFNEGCYSPADYYKECGYTILEFSDFDWSKEFTKADLKTGDVVLKRNGYVEIVNRDLEILIRRAEGWNDLDKYEENLTYCTFRDRKYEEYDIMQVRRPRAKHECCFDAFERNLGTLVYERKEPEEMTLAEVCKLLGKEIKIIP